MPLFYGDGRGESGSFDIDAAFSPPALARCLSKVALERPVLEMLALSFLPSSFIQHGETLALTVDSVVPGNFIVWSSTPVSDPAALSCSRPLTIDVVAKVYFIFSSTLGFLDVMDPSRSKDVVSEVVESTSSTLDSLWGSLNFSGPFTKDPRLLEICAEDSLVLLSSSAEWVVFFSCQRVLSLRPFSVLDVVYFCVYYGATTLCFVLSTGNGVYYVTCMGSLWDCVPHFTTRFTIVYRVVY